MSLKSSNKVETNVYALEIGVDAETFENAINKAYNQNKKKIFVQGFRPGKAPRAIIEKKYGAEVFYEDALDIVYPDAVEGAIKEAELEIVDRPFDVEIPEIGKDGVTIKLKVTVKPEVELAQYKGLKVSKKAVEVTDEDIDAEINKLLERNSRLINVEDRAVETGDIAVIDFEGFVDEVAFEGGKGENYNLTIGSDQFIPGFEAQIIGHKVDDEFDINVSFPEDYAQELAGKDATFKIKLHEIKVKELPELDDEFAKDVSEFETVDELKESTKKELQERKEKEADAEFENKLLERLVENLTAEIPEVMFANRVEESLQDMEYRMQMQGMNLETYLAYTGSDLNSLKESLRPQAESQVKTRLALDKVVELEDIKATEEDLAAEYEKLAKAYNMEVDAIKAAVRAEDFEADIAVNKAIDLLKETAVAEDAE